MIRDYTASLVSELLLEHYGLKGSIKELAGYTDKNFMLKVENEGVERYTIKISSVRENRNLIEMQNFVFKQMEEQGFQGQGCKFPRLIPTLERKDMVIISESNESNYLRILTYVEGHEIWELEDAPLHLFDEAGQLAAHLSIFLEKISYDPLVISLNSNGSSDNHYDNISTVNIYFQKCYTLLDQRLFSIVEKTIGEYNTILPLLKNFPKQILHNDICVTNLLVSKGKESDQFFISGLIDFSSMIYSYGILELVILCARINLCPTNPLQNLLRIIVAYNKVKKLSEDEKKVLFPLIKVRLAFLYMLTLATEGPDLDPYVQKCKKSIMHYLETMCNHCSNEEFLELLQKQLQ